MLSPRIYFARMNAGRKSWMSEAQLVRGCQEFFKLNDYDKLEFDKVFDQGDKVFNSLLVGLKLQDGRNEMVATYFRPKIERFEASFFTMLESMLFDILDRYEEDANLMLVTDSLSYTPLIRVEELGVAIQNLMDQGLFLLLMNDRNGYALFDSFEKLTMPIPISDDA
jgi:hypothetical protein